MRGRPAPSDDRHTNFTEILERDEGCGNDRLVAHPNMANPFEDPEEPGSL